MKNKIWEKHAKFFVYENLFEPFVNHIRLLKKKYRPKVCLDLACGDGRFLDVISENTILTLGVDISRIRLQRAKKRKNTNIELVLADASCLPFRNSSFDGVFIIELLEHMSVRSRCIVLQETKRVTRGFLFITLPNPLAPHAHADPTHILNYSVKTLRKLMQNIFDTRKVIIAGSHLPFLKTPFWRCNMVIRSLLRYVPYASTTFICVVVVDRFGESTSH
jgi:SAM-dependent methyltransferase